MTQSVINQGRKVWGFSWVMVGMCVGVAGCTSSDVLAPVEIRQTPTGATAQVTTPTAVRTVASSTCPGGTLIVQKGDTLYGIARRCGVPLRALITANGLRAPYTLRPGQRLQLPRVSTHTVSAGETLYGIARRYSVDVAQLVRLNRIDPPYVIVPGQQLVLPGSGSVSVVAPAPVSPPPAAPAPRVSQPAPTSGVMLPQRRPVLPTDPQQAAPQRTPQGTVMLPQPRPGNLGQTSARPSTVKPVDAPRSDGQALSFDWPLRGKIISNYGAKAGGQHNDGINIAAALNAAVRASEAGVVAYAGNGLRGFGNLLLLKHKDGYVTAYAHNSRLLVKRGEKIQKGQIIARVGQSGNVDSPQLHFEVRQGTKALDPRSVLGNFTS